jgi:hypothetical protein
MSSKPSKAEPQVTPKPVAATAMPHKGTVAIGGGGPSVHTIHVSRTMTFYPISKRELNHIAAVNTVVLACFSVATFFLGLLGGCVWDVIQQENRISAGQIAFVVACIVFAAVAAILGGLFRHHKHSELRDILEEATQA